MAKRESKKQVSPSLGDPRGRHDAKPKETPPIFDARDWVQLTDAFVQVMLLLRWCASPVRHQICCGIAPSWSGMYVNFWRTKSVGSPMTTSPFIGN